MVGWYHRLNGHEFGWAPGSLLNLVNNNNVSFKLRLSDTSETTDHPLDLEMLSS